MMYAGVWLSKNLLSTECLIDGSDPPLYHIVIRRCSKMPLKCHRMAVLENHNVSVTFRLLCGGWHSNAHRLPGGQWRHALTSAVRSVPSVMHTPVICMYISLKLKFI
jgi:hypothetical protein